MAQYFTSIALVLFSLIAFPDYLEAAPREALVYSGGKTNLVCDSEFDQMQSVLDAEFKAVRWMRKDLEKTLRRDRQNELEYLQILKDYELALKDLILHLSQLHEGKMRVTFYWFQNQLRVVNQAQEKVLRRSVRILFENFSSEFFQDQWRMRLGEPLLSTNPIWVRAKSHHFADFLEIYQSVVEHHMSEIVELKEQARKISLGTHPSDDPWVDLEPKLDPPTKISYTFTAHSPPLSRFEAPVSQISSSPDSSPIHQQNTSTEPHCSSLSSFLKPQAHSITQDLIQTNFQEFMTLGPLWRR